MNGPADYAELPELTDDFFDRAELVINGVPAARKPGRPALTGAKQQVTLRLDPAVIEGFRATGPGWQARVNEAWREWLARQAA